MRSSSNRETSWSVAVRWVVPAKERLSLAVGKTATQSSTPGYPTAGAGGAVDGNPDGNFFNGFYLSLAEVQVFGASGAPGYLSLAEVQVFGQ